MEIIAAIIGVLSMLGFSYTNLNNKISTLEEKSRDYLTEAQSRRILADKLEAYATKLDNVEKDIQDIARKMEKLLDRK